jgi:sulfite exporter TauE/SafE
MVGVVLMAAALRLLDRRGRLAFASLPAQWASRWLRPLQHRVLPANTSTRRVLAGVLWGWLPCGLSTTVLLAAAFQGSAPGGAATMLAFGVGTLPAMVPLTWSGARLGQWLQRSPLRIPAGGMILLAGLVTLLAPWLAQTPALHRVLTALGCRSVG